MAVTDKEIKRISILALVLVLFALSFLIIKPIFISVVFGLILAYAFVPLYRKILSVIKERNTSALTVCLLLILVIFIPLWFLIPIVTQQVFDTFTLTQSLDIKGFVSTFFPTSSPQFENEVTTALISFVGKITSASLNTLLNILLGLPTILLHTAVVIFVFFFTLRDYDKLQTYVSGISPFKKEHHKVLVKQFKDITSSIVFGHIVVGIIQGIVTGIGMLIFGVPQALLLTFFAVFASVIPLIGPWIIWVPVALYLFSIGETTPAILFTIYSAVLVSSIDNILRPYIVAKKSGTSSVIVLIGMIGGLFVFGILGLILGPLILSYLILFLTAYREKTLSEMFTSE